MQSEITVQALTNQLNDAKQAKVKLERLRRLCKNKDFKELILEEYGVQEAARLIKMSIHPSQNLEERAKWVSMAQACGGVEMFIFAQEALLNAQINTIDQLESELESARQEDQDAVESDDED